MKPSFLSLLFLLLFVCIFNNVEGEERRIEDFNKNNLIIEIFKSQFLYLPPIFLHHPSHRQKRLTLYPMMNIVETSSSSTLNSNKNLFFKRKLSKNNNQNQQFLTSLLASNNFQPKNISPNESIQICLFLRKGCEKLQRGHSSRLADFVQNLDVQEKVSNGFVLQRNKTNNNFKKNNYYSTRHIRRLKK
uniref:Uncharacterized protein n=1 Tax=Meloidogyne enterolobii TaxID=390850 RepID=A0A6V7WZ53_MELEN|nr:unnamed protein product [Meloidogyne enterolobii]